MVKNRQPPVDVYVTVRMGCTCGISEYEMLQSARS
jgi:hypothetical protein